MTTIKILSSSICAIAHPSGASIVYGIGADQKIYYWDTVTGGWLLDVVPKSPGGTV